MTGLVAGLDLGTSSVKLVVLEADGTLVTEAEESYPTHTAAGGVVEQQPQDWWQATAAVLRRSGVAGRISVLGLTGQMQDLVPVRGGEAVRAAILYSDTRPATQHRRLRDAVPDWETRTGNHQDVSNVAAKIAWLAEHEPAVLAEAEHLLLGPAGYVAHRAGARAACDVTTASATGLLDVAAEDWFHRVVVAAGADPALLPLLTGVGEGDGLVGQVDRAAAEELGLAAGTPLVLAEGDAGSTTAGLIGTEPGDAYLYLGTTGWLAGITPADGSAPSPIHSLVLPGWANRLRIGAVQSAGSAAAWALRTFLPGATFAEAEERARPRLAAVADRPLCLPGLTGERTPVRDSDQRAAFVGVQATTAPEDLYLSVLTGVAMGLRHAATEMGIDQRRIPLVGGASGSALWRQVLADVFGASIVTSAAAGAPGAQHAARAAADAAGLQHGLRAVFEDHRGDETQPSDVHGRLQEQLGMHRGLYDALRPTFHRQAENRQSGEEEVEEEA
ncbi:FGGY family carbohydrate kinase [Tessaracoccus terricola]